MNGKRVNRSAVEHPDALGKASELRQQGRADWKLPWFDACDWSEKRKLVSQTTKRS